MNFSKLKQIAMSESGFLFNPLSGDMFQVNTTGLFLLEQFKKEKTAEEVIAALLEEFDVDKIEAEKDLELFLKQLQMYGMISLDKKDMQKETV